MVAGPLHASTNVRAPTRRGFVIGAAALALGACQFGKKSEIYRLPNGQRFGMIGGVEGQAKPVVFRFLGLLENSLYPDLEPNINYGQIVVKNGCVLVSLDVPCQGEDHRKDEPQALSGWRYRIDRGEPLMAPFVKRCRDVLDYLIATGIADERRIVATGISRGAFCAMHFAAQDHRISAIVGMAAVTDLSYLREFNGYETGPEPIPVDRITDRPTLIVMNENDPRVGTKPALELAAKLPKSTVEIVNATGHGVRGKDQFVADWIQTAINSSAL